MMHDFWASAHHPICIYFPYVCTILLAFFEFDQTSYIPFISLLFSWCSKRYDRRSKVIRYMTSPIPIGHHQPVPPYQHQNVQPCMFIAISNSNKHLHLFPLLKSLTQGIIPLLVGRFTWERERDSVMSPISGYTQQPPRRETRYRYLMNSETILCNFSLGIIIEVVWIWIIWFSALKRRWLTSWCDMFNWISTVWLGKQTL